MEHSSTDMKQVAYDFQVVRNTVSVVAGDDIWDAGLSAWSQHLAFFTQGTQQTLIDTIKSTVRLVAGMDRPMMLTRFQEYARRVLNEQDFRDNVVEPQIEYDFSALIDLAHTDALKAELIMCRSIVLSGFRTNVSFSKELLGLLLEISHRPWLSARLKVYFEGLAPDLDAYLEPYDYDNKDSDPSLLPSGILAVSILDLPDLLLSGLTNDD